MLTASQLLNEIKKPIDNWDLTGFTADGYRMLLEKYESDYKQISTEISAQNASNRLLVEELHGLQKQIAEKYRKLATQFIKEIHLEPGMVITVRNKDYYFLEDLSELDNKITPSADVAYYLKRDLDEEYHPENTDAPLHEWVVKRCPIWSSVKTIQELPKGTLLKAPSCIGFLDHILETNEGIRVAIRIDSILTTKGLQWVTTEKLQYLSNQKPLHTQ